MREKARIKRILKLIEDKWDKVPDQRFGQLLINNGICEDQYNLWSLEDDELEEHLKKIK
jgi:hypothetical protein